MRNKHCRKVIEMNIVASPAQIPAKRNNGRPHIYPYHDLEVGQMLTIRGMKSVQGVASNVCAYSKKTGKKYVIRLLEPEMVAVMRIA